jgi:gliding motility-associated-like protein
MQLIDTLDNFYGPNSSPLLTVVPTPFFCLDDPTCYNPGAVDPEGDSLRFALIAATNGTGGCGAVGGPTPYVASVEAWPGQPITAATPLQCLAGSFGFDPASGQVCFNANYTQRSVVVYNIREFRNDTFKGTSQREMTFLVLACTSAPPTSGAIGASGGIITDGPTNFHVCGNVGPWSLTFNPTAADPTLSVTCTATGFGGTGITFSVIGNGTPTPACTITGPAGLPPGLYYVYVTLKDNKCPISGIKNIAYLINVYPVPDMTVTTVSPVTCSKKAFMGFTPSGTGKPWRFKLTDHSLLPPLDTINSWTDSLTRYDSVKPGDYTVVTYSSLTNECPDTISFHVENPPIFPRTTFVSPTYCGAPDGSITIHGLDPFEVDTVRYDKDGFPQTTIISLAAIDSTVVIPSLRARKYSNIVVKTGYCISPILPDVVLVNPPFPWSTVSFTNPTKCGFCDGQIVLHGLHPSQYDTLFYNYNSGPTISLLSYIGSDSSITLSSLCRGNYANFIAHTDSGRCITAPRGPFDLDYDLIHAGFDTSIHYGCHGDTVVFTNTSTHNTVDTVLYYTWNFGDGTTSNEVNPVHIYSNSATDTVFDVKLLMTNTKCIDSFKLTITLRNYVDASFTITPDNFICQGKDLLLTNNSTGGNPVLDTPLQYKWIYADGNNSTDPNVSHTHAFTNSGRYNVMLVANNMIPCYDTAYAAISVDSVSGIDIEVTDSVICHGQSITFTGLYSNIGNGRNDSSVVWSFGDGVVIMNKNPVVYSYDGTGGFDVTVRSFYRACPDTTATRKIRVFAQPDIYLGPDTAICIGSAAIILNDLHNAKDPKARWMWNNDQTASGPSMVVTKPGIYGATVTIDGCSTSDTVFVANDCYVSIPNVFTPNGDGVNDYFFPRQLLSRSMTAFTMNIYNRWGQLIYQTQSIDGKGWDGAMNDVPQPAGVFVYIIDAKFKDGQVEHHQGNVTLLR